MCVARAELQLLALAARLGIAGAKPFKRGDAVCESLSGRSVLGAEVGKADAARSGSSMSIRKTSSSSPAKPRRFMVDCTGRWKASALGRRKSEVPVGGLARGSTAARGSAAAPRSRLSGREPIFFARNPFFSAGWSGFFVPKPRFLTLLVRFSQSIPEGSRKM